MNGSTIISPVVEVVSDQILPNPRVKVRSEERRALCRGLICGYVDSYTLLTFGVYTSFMSGNTIATGMHGGQGKWLTAGYSLLPIPPFVLGAFCGSLLQREKTHRQIGRTSIVVAGLLIVGVAAAYLRLPGWVCIVVLSAAMGMMNTTISQVGSQAVNLGFVTGDLKNIGDHLANILNKTPVSKPLASWDTHWYRTALLLSIWSSFLIGALAGAAFAVRIHVWTLLVPAAALVVLAVTDRTPEATD